jgi:hypothetical protein
MFEPILESSRSPFACIGSLLGGRGVDSRVNFWRCCLTCSFSQWRHLPSRSDEVVRLASPYTSLRIIVVCWGDWTSPRGAAWSCCDGACREEEASWVIIIGWWLCPLLVLVHEISHDKWILTRRCLPPGKVMMLLGVLPTCCGIKRRWGRFPPEWLVPGTLGLLMLCPITVGA